MALLTMVLALLLPVAAFPQSMTLCRAKPELLELGNSLPASRKAIAERKQLRIIALGSSSTSGYGVSNPAYAYPAQLQMSLDKAMPGVDVHVFNRGIGGQDVAEMAARMQADVKENPATLVVWQIGTELRHPPDAAPQVRALAAQRAGARPGAGRQLRADEPAIRPGRRGCCPTRKSTRRSWPRPPRSTVPACSAASRSCAAGTRTACPTRSSSPARRPAPQRLRPEVHRQACIRSSTSILNSLNGPS